MTPEERYLMDSFKFLKKGNHPEARLNAMMLCEGHDPNRFLAASQNLCRVLASVTLN